MAKSEYEYVRTFEADDTCLQNCWILVRIDGKGFHRFSDKHCFRKPNDLRSLHLMSHCAASVMKAFSDIVVSYGQSDEYSFIFRRETNVYKRRASKLSSLVVSLFTSTFVFNWSKYFGPDTPLLYPPSFDSRVVLYPTDGNIQDYLSWRQVDCHINNLYNTCYWKLRESGLNQREAEQKLSVTHSAEKHDMLFKEFKLNYNNEEEIFKKGTTIVRKRKSRQKRCMEPSPALPSTRSLAPSADAAFLTPLHESSERPDSCVPPCCSSQCPESRLVAAANQTAAGGDSSCSPAIGELTLSPGELTLSTQCQGQMATNRPSNSCDIFVSQVSGTGDTSGTGHSEKCDSGDKVLSPTRDSGDMVDSPSREPLPSDDVSTSVSLAPDITSLFPTLEVLHVDIINRKKAKRRNQPDFWTEYPEILGQC